MRLSHEWKPARLTITTQSQRRLILVKGIQGKSAVAAGSARQQENNLVVLDSEPLQLDWAKTILMTSNPLNNKEFRGNEVTVEMDEWVFKLA